MLEKEKIITEFGDFIKAYYHAGDESAIKEWLRSPEAQKIDKLTDRGYDPKRAGYLTEDQQKEIFELMGNSYGFAIDIPDATCALRHLLDFGVRNVRTLSVGCGVAPYELYLTLRGVVDQEIVGIDYVQSVVSRARELASQMAVRSIRFEQISGTQMSFQDEFDQVWFLDSLHWMQDWKTSVAQSIRALREGGSLFINYSRYSPRVRINEFELVSLLQERGMSLASMDYQQSSAGTPRVVVTATKEVAAPTGLIIARALPL